jgi:putative photosynthetic complex assembly protein
LLGGVVALVAATVLLAGAARHTGAGATRLAEPTGGRSLDLRFEDTSGGGILVTDVAGRMPPQQLVAGQDGFVRVALRSLARERIAEGAGPDRPFRLGRQDDGRLWLRDLATGRLLYLDAYGYANAQSFARLIDAAHGGTN